MSKLTRREKYCGIAAVIICVISYLWVQLALSLGERAEFMRSLGLTISNTLCRIWGWSPVPIAELVWIFGVIGFVVLLIYLVHKRRWHGVLAWVCRLALFLSIIYMFFSFVYLVNYSGPSLADKLGMTVNEYSVSELKETALIVAERVNYYAETVNRDTNGIYISPDYDDLADMVGESYQSGTMSAQYGLTAKKMPKEGIFLSKIMSYLNLAGYYFPPTGESVISQDIIDTSIAHTIAHEIAHSFGTGSEKEANFAAFLACIESDSDDLNYSGYFNGYIALNNALYRTDKLAWLEVYDGLSPLVRADLAAKNAHLAKYEGKINDFGTAVNDAFIKSTGQEGIQSYGLVADMIIAYYIEG